MTNQFQGVNIIAHEHELPDINFVTKVLLCGTHMRSEDMQEGMGGHLEDLRPEMRPTVSEEPLVPLVPFVPSLWIVWPLWPLGGMLATILPPLPCSSSLSLQKLHSIGKPQMGGNEL